MPNHGITGLSVTQDEVDLFLDYLVETDPVPGKVHEKSQEAENTDLRDVNVRYIDAKEDRLYRILNRVAVSANKYFRYDISGIETAQILHYKSPSNGYGYHIDIGPEGTAANRKISMSLMLNDEYEGGGTWFSRQQKLHKGKTGYISIHPSIITHRHGARPVTKGERYVLVSFCKR